LDNRRFEKKKKKIDWSDESQFFAATEMVISAIQMQGQNLA